MRAHLLPKLQRRHPRRASLCPANAPGSIGMTRIAGELVAIPHPMPKSGFKAAPAGQVREHHASMLGPAVRGRRPAPFGLHSIGHALRCALSSLPLPAVSICGPTAPGQRLQRDHVSLTKQRHMRARTCRARARHAHVAHLRRAGTHRMGACCLSSRLEKSMQLPVRRRLPVRPPM